ncbi:MAG: radical SAM protein, partial [Angelakisella sp.]
MIVVTDSQKLHYELSNVARLFFPAEEMQWCKRSEELYAGLAADPSETVVLVEEAQTADSLQLAVRLLLSDDRQVRLDQCFPAQPAPNRAIELGKLLYRLLEQLTGRSIDWGVLTGIRPVKLARKLRTDGKTPEEIEAFFVSEYLTTPQKATLCRLTDQVQQEVVTSALPHGYSLYISIPFCPSRCSYCSFVSHSIEKTWKLLPDYLNKLCLELAETAKIVAQKGLVLQTVYIGGGTPTVLSAQQLDTLLATVREQFDLCHCTEFTVEAGRPDTITPDKLEVLRRYGVDRISVNCQTLSDSVLEQIGRKHTAQQFLEAYSLVKNYD